MQPFGFMRLPEDCRVRYISGLMLRSMSNMAMRYHRIFLFARQDVS
jgi:hypothetical protein